MFIDVPRPNRKQMTKTFSGNSFDMGWRRAYVTSDWPQQTGDCWHCCHPFVGMPYPLPTNHDDRLDLFTLRGCFCSWACVKGYNNETGGSRTFEISALVAFLIKRVYGCSVKVAAAPPRITLDKFGGPFSIDDFRSHSKNLKLTREMMPNIFSKDAPISDYIIDDCKQLKDKQKQAASQKIVDSEAMPSEHRIKRRGTEKKKNSNTLARLIIGD